MGGSMTDVIDRLVLAMNNHDLERWHWTGTNTDTNTDGQPLDMRGVTLFQIRDDQIVAGRLYMGDVDREGLDIDQVVLARSGKRPQMPTEWASRDVLCH
jgi:hypothetical protein